MRKRRLTVLIALCAALTISGPEQSEEEATVAMKVQVYSGPSTSELHGEYQIQLLFDIRKEHLVAKTGINEELAARIITAVDKEAEIYGIHPNRILALIIIESWGNPNAVSKVGALGLMQVMPATGEYIARKSGFRWSGVEELRIVESNISYGSWYYDHLLQQFDGDEHAATGAYNWGPDNISRRIARGKALPKVYPGKVLAAEKELQGVIWDEYQSRFWRGADQYVSDTYRRLDTARSASGSSDCELRRDDEQGVCVWVGTSVPASPGDLSR